MQTGEGSTPASVPADGAPRRVAVFIDYWWVYSSARQVFAAPRGPPPAWFGNVTPQALAHALVKRPPAATRRSARVPGGLHVFVRSYDPEVHHGQHERVQRWTADGATVHVGPRREEGGGFWQSSVSVALAGAVAEALARGDCDTAVVFAGDLALLPLVDQVAGPETPSTRLELATWVAPDGSVPSALVQQPTVWCHRLGETSFRQVTDDRRAVRHAVRAPQGGRPAGPATAMAAAFRAAGVPRPNRLPQRGAAAADGGGAQAAERRPMAPAMASETTAGRLHRLTHRLFGRGAHPSL